LIGAALVIAFGAAWIGFGVVAWIVWSFPGR
jgi:hypothetical protein